MNRLFVLLILVSGCSAHRYVIPMAYNMPNGEFLQVNYLATADEMAEYAKSMWEQEMVRRQNAAINKAIELKALELNAAAASATTPAEPKAMAVKATRKKSNVSPLPKTVAPLIPPTYPAK